MKTSNPSSRFIGVVLVILLFFAATWAQADYTDDAFTPVYQPKLQVSKTAGKIRIDGQLDDSGWRGVASADNFAEHRPGDQTKPPVETKAFITYDEDKLYVSFVCFDDPTAIRASYAERERVFDDDNVVLLIDTYGDAAWAYTLNVNPYGIQADALWSPNTGEDRGFDLIWESAGAVTDSGYQVEMAIPFAALRFPSREQQTWKIDFYRNHPRETQRAYSWAAYDRNEQCWPCQWGTVTGIEHVSPGKGIELISAWVGQQDGNLSQTMVTESETENTRLGSYDYDFDYAKALGALSLGGKYSLSSDITVEATYNPDFSQIEADAGQIDVNTTFALFYPERRPFFQEGSDLFRTLFNSYYSRTINDPVFAAKVTARGSRTGFGYLIARDENSPITLPFEEFSDYLLAGKSTVNILRLRQSLGSSAHAGIIATHRRFDEGGSGSVIAADGRIRFAPTLSLDYQLIAAHTDEANDPSFTQSGRFAYLQEQYLNDDSLTAAFDGESYWGHGGLAVLRWWTRTWNASLNYWEVSPTYRADNGFDPKINRRDLTMAVGYQHRPAAGLFVNVNPLIETGGVWNYDGVNKERFVRVHLFNQLSMAQTTFHTIFALREELLKSFDTKYNDLWGFYQEGSARLGDPVAFGGDVTYGRRLARRYGEKARILDLNGWTEIKPHDRIRMSQWINFTRAQALDDDAELFKTYIYHTRIDYQISRPLTFRLVAEYNDGSESWSIDPLLTYRINPFSVLYVGSSSSYTGQWPTEYRQDYDAVDDLWETTDEWGSATKLNSRQFFMKLQYLFQM